jgi:hypothetical protein
MPDPVGTSDAPLMAVQSVVVPPSAGTPELAGGPSKVRAGLAWAGAGSGGGAALRRFRLVFLSGASDHERTYIYLMDCGSDREMQPVRVVAQRRVVEVYGVWEGSGGFQLCDLRRAKPGTPGSTSLSMSEGVDHE